MKKILINLFSQSLTVEDFDYFSSEVPTQYEIYNYQFAVEEMFPDIVEAIINNLFETLDISLINTTIILQTNVADLGHFSAKFYAELLDAVIIIPQNTELLTGARNDFNIILKTLSADSEKLRLQKVYVQDKNKLDLNYLKFLYVNRLFNDVETINKFKPVELQKMRYDLVFKLPEGTLETNFSLNKYYVEFRAMALTDANSYIFNMYGMFLLIQFIHDLKDFSNEDKRDYIQNLLINVYQIKKNEELIEYISEYLKSPRLPIDKFADFNYICMAIGDKWALKRQYKYLKENFNYLNPAQVYALLTNSIFYESQLDQITYNGLIEDRLLIMREMNRFWRTNIQIPKVQKRDNRIAIIAGQLLGINHAPTKLAIDYANMLKKYIPGVEVKIFVDDYASYSPQELTWINIFASQKSSKSKDTIKYLNPEIEVHYSDNRFDRKKRIQEDINAIVNFQPSILYKMGSNYSLTTDLLFPYFPIVSHTMGGAEDCEFVDIFTGGYYNDVMGNMYRDFNLVNQEYHQHRVGIKTPQKKSIMSRSDYYLSIDDFVLVTVGNRLETEVTEEFVKKMVEVLNSDGDIKWVIVGSNNIPLINDKFSNYIKEKRITFINYEPHLFDFYDICDVYVNPIRKTGGISGAWAMKAKLPIITTDVDSDIGGLVGIENCVEIDEFMNKIFILKNDKNYYKEKSEEMYERIETLNSIENTITDLMEIFKVTSEKFEKRVKGK